MIIFNRLILYFVKPLQMTFEFYLTSFFLPFARFIIESILCTLGPIRLLSLIFFSSHPPCFIIGCIDILDHLLWL